MLFGNGGVRSSSGEALINATGVRKESLGALDAAPRLALFGGVEDQDGCDGIEGFGGELDAQAFAGLC
jgi:hypothetical protein